MSRTIQQEDLEAVMQHKRTLYVKAELLNRENFKTVEMVEGEMISDDYSFDADSDIRKTYKTTFVVKDSTFKIGRDTKIWLDKYIRLSIGIYHIRLHEILWFPVGIFIFGMADYAFDSQTRTLSLSCMDRMVELTGDRNGQVSGSTTSIPMIGDGGVENTIRGAMISTITQLGGIEVYRIEDVGSLRSQDVEGNSGKVVPYDMDFGTGSYVFDIVKELRDLYPGWETLFDEEFFVCQPIPTCLSDPIVFNKETIAPLVISENTNFNFSQIKNVTEVWGKCLESDHFATAVVLSGNTYNLTSASVTAMSNGMKIGFTANADSPASANIKIGSFTAYPIVRSNNTPIEAEFIKAGKSYVLQYKQTGSIGQFYYLGEHQIIAITKLVSTEPTSTEKATDIANSPTDNISYIVNPDSPYCCDYPDVGEIRQVLSGGEFDNIYSEDLALQRAEYENWRTTDMLDSISLEMVDIPWIDVNQKIEYRSQATGEVGTYIVKSKSGSSMTGTMSIGCVKFQPLYPWQS